MIYRVILLVILCQSIGVAQNLTIGLSVGGNLAGSMQIDHTNRTTVNHFNVLPDVGVKIGIDFSKNRIMIESGLYIRRCATVYQADKFIFTGQPNLFDKIQLGYSDYMVPVHLGYNVGMGERWVLTPYIGVAGHFLQNINHGINQTGTIVETGRDNRTHILKYEVAGLSGDKLDCSIDYGLVINYCLNKSWRIYLNTSNAYLLGLPVNQAFVDHLDDDDYKGAVGSIVSKSNILHLGLGISYSIAMK